MAIRQVKTSRDHIQTLAAASPVNAVEELIWNGLDAGGPGVEVRLFLDSLGAIQTVEVVDNGVGIPMKDLDQAFGEIGNSSKPKLQTNADGRSFHGREGKGRLKALALSRQPEWITTYRSNGKLRQYTVRINRDSPELFDVSDEIEIKTGKTGTVVRLEYVDQECDALGKPGVKERLTQRFALYLSEYPGTSITFAGELLRVDDVIKVKKDYEIVADNGEQTDQVVSIIEWEFKLDNRKLYLCNESGFSYHDLPLRLQFPGVDYTAYFRSPLVKKWADSGLLATTELDQSVQKVIDGALTTIRKHIREQLAASAKDVVAEWKEQDVYPYRENDPKNPLAIAEQQVFDIVAVHVNALHPTFRRADLDNKRLTLVLIRKALESNPSTLASLLRSLVETSEEEQEELRELLQRTTLSSLIKAGSLITQRLDTLQAFSEILYQEDWRARLLERTQLHRLLMHELWILGEEFQIATDDEGLRDVLLKHLQILKRADLAPIVDVKLIDGRDGVPDVMLWHRGKIDRTLFEHLIIELKRPSEPLGVEEVTQIEKYAFTVAADERFKTDKVRWRFVLLGNDLSEYAIQRASSDNLPPGCIHQKGNISIWVLRWSDVLADASARYEFFRAKLDVQASKDHGLERFKTQYEHLLSGRGMRKKKDQAVMAEKAKANADETSV